MLFKAPIISDLFLSSWQHTIEQSVKFLKESVIFGANMKLSQLKAGMHFGVIIVWMMMCFAISLIICLEAYLRSSQISMMDHLKCFTCNAPSDVFDWFLNTLLLF